MVIELIDAMNRELFAVSVVFMMIGGLDDLAVDILYIVFRLRGKLHFGERCQAKPPAVHHRFAVFVPAWDESSVIAQMLGTMLARWPS